MSTSEEKQDNIQEEFPEKSPEDSPSVKHSRDDLKKIAQGIHSGAIFCDRHIAEHDADLITTIFMPLIFLDEEQRKQMVDAGVDLLFEELHKAGPRAINGYPSFFSFQTLNRSETAIVFEFVEKIESALSDM